MKENKNTEKRDRTLLVGHQKKCKNTQADNNIHPWKLMISNEPGRRMDYFTPVRNQLFEFPAAAVTNYHQVMA